VTTEAYRPPPGATTLYENLPFARASAWFHSVDDLLTKEFAPSRRRLINSLRLATIGTVGAGLMAAAHVDTPLGPYLVWLMIGAAPMLSLLRAVAYLIAEAPLLVVSVPVAGLLAETPWLMLPFLFAFTAYSTQQVVSRKLGAFGLVLQIVALDTFYAVVFAPDDFGWGVSSIFGASVIAFFLIFLFDRFLWPDPAEALLLDSIASSAENNRTEFLKVASFYLDGDIAVWPPEPGTLSQLPTQLALLNNAAVEGITPRRRAILLAAATREERLYTQISQLIISARENVPREERAIFRVELERIIETLAAALEELAREARTNSIRTGPDSGPSRVAARAQQAFDALDERIVKVRSALPRTIGVLEIGNFNAFCDTLHAMVGLIERPLDEPPAPSAAVANQDLDAPKPPPVDLALMRYSGKVALCMVIGYFIGLLTQRADLSVILTTIIITALPTYGASARKMVLRLVGTITGGVVTILAIIVVTPNFETLPSYMLAVFIVLFVSGYASLGSGRTSYAGKSIGTTFLLVFAALSPSVDVYGPLWRVWGILLGTMVVTGIFFLLWPEYASDSLPPRLFKALRYAVDLAPGGAASTREDRLHATGHDLTQVMIEILQVADDARLEGRKSLIDPDAVVNAAGTVRRIAHRLAQLSANRLNGGLPQLDAETEEVRAQVVKAIVAELDSWLRFVGVRANLNPEAARALAASHPRDLIVVPLELFSSRLAAGDYAQLSSFTPDQRRQVLAELQSLRRLEFLVDEMNRYLARVPGTPQARLQRTTE
jgi:hypothetical protein